MLTLTLSRCCQAPAVPVAAAVAQAAADAAPAAADLAVPGCTVAVLHRPVPQASAVAVLAAVALVAVAAVALVVAAGRCWPAGSANPEF